MSSSNSDSPGWTKFSGMRRVVAEFKSLYEHLSTYGFIKDLSLASDDNPKLWRLQFHNFDAALPGGRQLNEDLEKLNKMYGQDHILLELEFPDDYPSSPFFARVVSPMCVLYTGHVSAGGSICLEALTTSGTPGSWQSSFTVESLLNVIMVNMIDTPVVYIHTPAGPGGMTGPLRIDFSHGNPCKYSGYSSSSARAAFNRTVETHKKMGWPGPVMDTQQATTSSNSAGSSAATSVALSAPVTDAAAATTAAARAAAAGTVAAAAAAAAAVAAAATSSSSSSSASPGLRNQIRPAAPTTSNIAGSSAATGVAASAPVPVAAASSSSSSSSASPGLKSQIGPAPTNIQQPTAAAQVPKTSRRPRVQLEFDYPENWDHSVPIVNNAVRLVELPLPANIGGTPDSPHTTPPSSSTGSIGISPPSQASAAVVGQASASPIGGCSSGNRPLDPMEAAAQQQCLAAGDIQTLVRHCPFATEKDAKAALLLADGDLDGAAVVIAITLECGGAARKWREMFGDSTGAGSDSDDAMSEGQTDVLAEVESLLQHMEANGGGLRRSQVVKVERVQNPRLWKQYYLKREDLLESGYTEADLNERRVFHGTSTSTVDAISKQGFDFRVTVTSGYGRGVYFTDSCTTALSHSRSKQIGGGAELKLLVAKVLLGKQPAQGGGSAGLVRPPAGFDSVHSGLPGSSATVTGAINAQQQYPYCHVVFDNHQAYPEYIITLKRS